MAQIMTLVAQAYAEYMAIKMFAELPEDDETRMTLARPGRLQDDPTNPDTYLVIHSNKPGETNWRHTGTTTETSTPYGMRGPGGLQVLPGFEIGGGEMWWRRMSAEIGLFWLNRNYGRAEASEKAHIVFGRFEHCLMLANIDRSAGVLGLSDDFGETVLGVYLHSSNYNEGGGPPEDFIWRGEFWFDLLTERPFA